MFKNLRGGAFIISIIGVIAVTVIICVCTISCAGEKVTFETEYYFVCYRITDNSVSASSLSGTVTSYGGAGYILELDGDYFVTVACYYDKKDAESVCDSLKKRELVCTVEKVETKDYKLGANSRQTVELYEGNFNTLNSLSKMAYECANKLDTGEYSQSKAKEVLASIEKTIKGLQNANPSNCFTNDLNFLIAECKDKEKGYLYSRDMRYIQIAIADVIINAKIS